MGNEPQPAENPTDTARWRESQWSCRALTVDLALRRGAFWVHVRKHRHRLQYQAYSHRIDEWERTGGRCPDRDDPHSGRRRCPGCLACTRPDHTDDARRSVPPSLFDGEHAIISPIHALRLTGREGADVESAVRDLYYRHEADFAAVPPAVRQAFLAGCLQFDPPLDQLLDFADHALEWCAPAIPFSDSAAAPIREAAAQGLPIEWVPYLPDYRVAIEAQARDVNEVFNEAFKDALRAELSVLGLDAGVIEGTVHRAEQNTGVYLSSRLTERSAGSPTYSVTDALQEATPCIRVDPTTSDEDVRRAHRFLRHKFFPTGAARKPKQHPLVSVQCAVLHDELGWSFAEIGKHFGWTVEPLAYSASARCEAARKCVAVGRSIIGQE